MYNQLKEHGIAVKTVRSIATAFFDVSEDQMSFVSHSASVKSDSILRNTESQNVPNQVTEPDEQRLSYKSEQTFDSEEDRQSKLIREEIEKYRALVNMQTHESSHDESRTGSFEPLGKRN